MGFPGSSAGKESACNAGDTGLIPGSGSSPGEGIDYPLQYSWASLVAQMVKNMEDLGLTPGLGRSFECGHGNPLQYSCLEHPMDRRLCPLGYRPRACKESGMTERLRTALIVVFINISLLFIAEYYFMVWMYCSLFIHSPIKGH